MKWTRMLGAVMGGFFRGIDRWPTVLNGGGPGADGRTAKTLEIGIGIG